MNKEPIIPAAEGDIDDMIFGSAEPRPSER